MALLAAAVLLRWAADPWFDPHLPWPTLLVTVGLAVWFAGVGPAIVAAVLGYLALSFFFVDPRFTLASALPLSPMAAIVTGGCAGVIAIGVRLRAMTGRLHAVAAQLEDSEARFRAAEESSPMAFAIMRAERDDVGTLVDFEVTYANPALGRTLGCMPDALVGRRVSSMLTDEDAGALLARFGNVVDNGRPLDNEVLFGDSAISGWFHETAARHGDGVAVWFADIREKRQADETHARLAAIVESSNDAIISKTLDGIVTSWNLAATRIFGYEAHEMVGEPLVLIIPPERRGEEQEILARLRRGEQIEHYETERVTKDGQRVFVSLTISPLRDRAGNVIGASKISRDITARRQSEAALRALQERQAADLADMTRLHEISTRLLQQHDVDELLEDLLGAAMQITDMDHGTVQLLDPTTQCLRISVQRGFDAAFCNYFDTVRSGEAACGAAMLSGERVIVEDVMASPVFADPEMQQIMRAAGVRSVQSTPLETRDGALLGMLSTQSSTGHVPDERALRLLDVLARQAADLVERMRAEERLAASRQELKVVTDTTPAMLVRCDRDRRFRFVNKAYAGRLGCEPQDLIGCSIADVLGDEAAASIEPYVREVLDGRRVAYEALIPYERIGERWVHCVYEPECDPATGEVVGWVAALNDVTERRELEDRLFETDRRKDEFLATLAHELRNPLAPIRNAVDYLKLQAPADAAVISARDLIDRQLQTLTRLVDDLLDISRVTRGRIDLKKERITLQDVLDNAVEAARPLLEAAGHRFDLHTPREPIHLEADLTRLSQVVLNLLSNAAKYTPDQGRIALEAERDGADVVIRVRDTGMGIPEDMRSRVFDVFAQAEQSMARAQGGLGIGLTLVKRLVELHGGSVDVCSAGAGRGSEFSVRLPALPAAHEGRSADPVPAQRAMTEGLAGCRVLIVDDNRDAAESMAMLLELARCEVRIALDGVAGIELATQLRPHVVLLDLGMPDMDGLEVCRRIRALDLHPRPLIMALTGWGKDRDRQLTEDAGFDHHVVKPVDIDALMRLIDEAQCEPRASARS